MEPRRKAVLYVRVSSKEQEDGHSLDSQEREGVRYATQRGLEIVRMWRVSESAWKEEREAFNEMIAYIKAQPDVPVVIFDSVDRMTRNLSDVHEIMKLTKQHDKEVHLSRSGKIINKESGPDDSFMMGIEALTAKRYSDEISFKVKRVLRDKADKGNYPSVAPLGYLNNPKTRLIDLDLERAPLIKRLWELRATGLYSLRKLEELAYAEGLRTKTGKRFHHANLEIMFKNPFYYGDFIWKGQLYQGSHPPLITKHLFEKVQGVAKQGNIPKMVRRDFAFAGLLTCGQCGCAITSEIKKKRYIYYHCTHSKGNCEQPSIVEERLDEKLLGVVQRIQLAPDVHNRILTALRRDKGQQHDYREAQLVSLQTRRDTLQRRIDKLYEDKLDGKINEDFWQVKHTEWTREKTEVERAINGNGHSNGVTLDTGEKILELTQRLYPLYVKQPPHERRRMLRILLSNCALLNGSPCPEYRRPFDIFVKGPSCSEWLPGEDSNLRHADYRVPLRFRKAWTISSPSRWGRVRVAGA